jgi:hypothetical protein
LPITIKAKDRLLEEFRDDQRVVRAELNLFLSGQKEFFLFKTKNEKSIRYDWKTFYGTKSYFELWEMVGAELESEDVPEKELTLEEEFDLL